MLLKGLQADKDVQISALVAVIQSLRPDILLLNDFDFDYDNLALTVFRDRLAQGENGVAYPYFFASAGNAGRPSGRDLDGDGIVRGWRDAYGFGRFPGNGAMAIVSRYPLGAVRSFDLLEWRGGRLASRALWDVEVVADPAPALHILATHATVPVFGGTAGENAARNGAELDFWRRYLEGEELRDDAGLTTPFAGGDFILLGDFNNDPQAGAGLKPPLLALLRHPDLQDPLADRVTVEWRDPGPMRVDYVLPSRGLRVTGAGVFRPPPDSAAGAVARAASHHFAVWVDVAPM